MRETDLTRGRVCNRREVRNEVVPERSTPRNLSGGDWWYLFCRRSGGMSGTRKTLYR